MFTVLKLKSCSLIAYFGISTLLTIIYVGWSQLPISYAPVSSSKHNSIHRVLVLNEMCM